MQTISVIVSETTMICGVIENAGLLNFLNCFKSLKLPLESSDGGFMVGVFSNVVDFQYHTIFYR